METNNDRNGYYLDDYGTEWWYLNDKLHRDNGPAVIYPDGEKYWYQNDELHREDGPAIVYSSGKVEFWIKGKQYVNIIDYARNVGWTEKQLVEYLLGN